jgi:YfiR/HmsC-like
MSTTQANSVRRAVARLTRCCRSLSHPILRLLLCAVFLLTAFCSPACAQISAAQGLPSESELRAAFVYNFAKFVEWPPESFSSLSDPLELCISGDEVLLSDLRRMANGKTIGGRSSHVRAVDDDQINGCHVLYIGSSHARRAQHMLAAAGGGTALTIGENEAFIADGGVISLVFDGNRIRFEVNLKAAQSARLKVSSKLLTLATSVQR